MGKLETFVVTHAIKIISAVLIALVIIGWLGYNSWRNSRNTSAVVSAERSVSNANSSSGQNASNTVAGNQAKNQATDEKTATVIRNYINLPGAEIKVDPQLFDGFRKSICLYKSASKLPECAGMLEVHP